MKGQTKTGRVAAFFDLDGTLIAQPSLERRFFADLRRRRAIPVWSYFLWLARMAWLGPRGIETMRHANKMYLRGVRKDAHESCRAGQPPGQGSGQTEMAVPRFFPEAVDTVAWHAEQGHEIVLVSGTLAPLAQEMALALVVRLAVRGITASVAVCATRLEECAGRWTGRIAGDAMFGKTKAQAVRQMAICKRFELGNCYAYGDSLADRWMLEAVGHAAVVNPAWRMDRLARRRGWAVLTWQGTRNLTPRPQRTQRRDHAEKVA
jgi:HAD superfamily hydrolase (TIGR01490 family)